jgi:hypothetical protein
MADTRWLERRGRTFYAVKDVPRPLQAVPGKRRFIVSLKTRDLHVAVARRYAALTSFEVETSNARAQSTASPLIEAGMAWRGVFASIDRGDPAQLAAFGSGQPGYPGVEMTLAERARDEAAIVLDDEADRIRDEQGKEAAAGFLGVAQGRATPLLHYIDQWVAEGGARGPVAERTQRQYRSDLVALEAWAKASGVSPVIEAFDRKVVGRFVTEAMVATGANRKTANRKISAASSYWRWLGKRVGIDLNPWSGQSLSKAKQPDGKRTEPRPFTDAELAAPFGRSCRSRVGRSGQGRCS